MAAEQLEAAPTCSQLQTGFTATLQSNQLEKHIEVELI